MDEPLEPAETVDVDGVELKRLEDMPGIRLLLIVYVGLPVAILLIVAFGYY